MLLGQIQHRRTPATEAAQLRHPQVSGLLRRSVLRAVAEPQSISWSDIKDIAGTEPLERFYLNANSAPSTSPTPPLPPSPNPASSKPVVLFRDTNAWCPYCQKVWMALLEKNIPFDSVLISLQNKPAWFKEVNEQLLTPVARINGQNIAESDDILLALEEQFPDSPSLLGADGGDTVKTFLATFKDVAPAIFRSTTVVSNDPAVQQEAIDTLHGWLASLEEQIVAHGGPHFCGKFSLADVTAAPFVTELLYVKNPTVQLEAFPHVKEAVDALMRRDSFKSTAVDRHTMLTIRKGLFGFKAPVTLDVSEECMAARKEAAAKVTANRGVVAKRIMLRSGVVRQQGSPFRETEENVNGYSMNSREGMFLQQSEAALLRVCAALLTGDPGPSPKNKEAVAIQVACLAYFRNLGSAPRDMSAPAIIELRAACDQVVQAAYEFPEKDLRPRR